MRLLYCCVLLATAITAAAQEPIVRIEITPGEVDVGESAELRVTVLVPTWFVQPPVYPDFELPNAITRLPPDSSFPMRERVGNESWSGIVRSYHVYPMVGAKFRFGGETIVLRYANPGADAVRVEVAVPEVLFRGAVPAGAEALDPYIAGNSLTLTLDVQGDTGNLAAGDALVLRYTAELDGMPAMFLPPLAPSLQLDGASAYADEPEVDDGDIARRSETITLVFETGGEFTIPATRLDYWNTTSGSVATVTTDALLFTVAGPAAGSPAESVSTSRFRWPVAAIILASLALSAIVVVRLVRAIAPRVREAAEKRHASEKYAFRELQQALVTRQPDVVYRSLLEWLARTRHGMTAASFARDFGDQALAVELAALSEHLFGNRGQSVEFHRLAAALRVARKRFLAAASPRHRELLPSMNP